LLSFAWGLGSWHISSPNDELNARGEGQVAAEVPATRLGQTPATWIYRCRGYWFTSWPPPGVWPGAVKVWQTPGRLSCALQCRQLFAGDLR